MAPTTSCYASYILRLWCEPGEAAADAWQAELECIQTGERHRFHGTEALWHYLRHTLPPDGETHVPQMPDP
jgi:hypothetical protein